ncbi:hypothetical protein GCM10009844_36940 [Nocardioides koreensis]|uniref:DUF3068 domain-containing protein n=1 Tax=Nocardioides koreensis TaxID=433651 RepID=A0ABP5LY29_9ACTN
MKRKWLGSVLVALGAFLVVAAIVAQVWAPDNVKRTPIDVNNTTYLDGQADHLNPETGKLESDPVYALQINQTDSNKSDGEVAVFVQNTCVVIDTGQDRVCVSDKDPNLLTHEVDVFAADRHTALSLNDEKYVPDQTVEHTGLNNKWPFDAQKTTYPYWDGTLGRSVDAVYERTTEVKGLEAYVYRVDIKDEPAEVLDGVQGVYDDVKEISIDPRTGAILNTTENQQRYLEDGQKILDLQLEFTDDTQQAKVDEANTKWDQINLVLNILPVVGYAVGIPVLLVGLALLFVRRRNSGPGEVPVEDTERPTPAGTASR